MASPESIKASDFIPLSCMVDHKVMKDLESRTFSDFNKLATYLRVKISGMPEVELAHTLGLSPHGARLLRDIETKGKIPSPDALRRYIAYFELQPEYAFPILARTLLKPYREEITRGTP